MDVTSVVGRKTRVPERDEREVPRPRLTDRLDALHEAGGRILLVTAAAGFGKTAAAGEWARLRREAGDDVAWVTLDPSDNRPGRFWHLLGVALTGEEAGWQGPDDDASLRMAMIDALIDRCAENGARVLLVLDNCEHLTHRVLLTELDYLIERTPATVTVMLCGRRTPDLRSLYKMDLDGTVGRLAQEDLVMRRREVRKLFAPERPDVEMLLDTTEGWAAAVAQAHRATAPDALSRSDPHGGEPLLERLCGPLFRSYRPAIRETLAAMALIEPFTVGDVEVALDRTDGAQLVARTVAETGMVVTVQGPGPADRFRLHRLFGRWFAEAAPGSARSDAEVVHARMAPHRLRQGHHALALHHAGKAHDEDLLRHVVSVSGLQLLWQNDLRTLASAVREIGLTTSGELALLECLIALAEGDPERAARAAARRGGPGGDAPRRLVPPFDTLDVGLEAQLLLLEGRAAEAVALLERLDLDDVAPDARVFALNIQVAALIAAARVPEARTLARKALKEAAARANPGAVIDAGMASASLATIAEDFPEASAQAQAAIRRGEEHGLRYSPRLRPAHLIAAWAAFHVLDDDGAGLHNAFVFRALTAAPIVAHSSGKLALILSFPTSGRRAEIAEELLDRVRFDLTAGAFPADVALCSLQVAEMMLSLQRSDDLARLKVDLRRSQGISGELHTISAWELVASGQLARARQLLTSVTSEFVTSQSRVGLVAAWALLARVELLEERTFKAREALEKALAIAARHRTVRGFAYAGDTVRQALETDRHHFPRYRREIDLIGRHACPPEALIGPPLTPREEELLALLPTFATVEELAHDLQISTNTVKTHIRGIYRKLGVGTRREAIAAASRLGVAAPVATTHLLRPTIVR
ncbi:LuxR C-terminal-related transcriptional regulator [Arthrobacter sp. B0490]|uniref:LuxR C-terminal-related transcriptional regulator n=1 Tax=Arthrobacter sp. B0490 TaxID=2058891 RepID=UPI000CE4D895|nr:LuxR C-terminal-related transcriptional regulator [Arthrobacter sp. B0490]